MRLVLGLVFATIVGVGPLIAGQGEEASPIDAAVSLGDQAALPASGCFYPFVMGDVQGRETVAPDPEKDVNALDALRILRKLAGFFLPGVDCSPMDIDCDGGTDAADGLWILRWKAGLPYHQDEPCPDIGTEIEW